MSYLYDGVEQINVYLPGSMTENEYILSANNLYITYCSSVSVIILDIKSKKIKNIVNKSRDNFVKSIALNKGSKSQIAIFYDYEIIIYDIRHDQTLLLLNKNNVIFMEFNKDNIIIVLTSNGELSYFDIFSQLTNQNKKNELINIKTKGNVLYVKWYPYNSSSLAYVNDKNYIYYIDINNSSKNSYIEIKSDDEIDSKMTISCIEWYDIDENYNYLLVGTSTSLIYLIDFQINNPYIIQIFERTRNSIKKLFWLNFQPGSFISINENTSKFYKWNVSKKNYNLIKRIGNLSINSCVKADNNHILFNDIQGNLFLYNLINNDFSFSIDSAHSQTIFDLKLNPFIKNIFATASFDSTIKIWDLKNKKVINTLYTLSYSNHIGGEYNDKKEKNHVICLKWSPNDKKYLSSGDSYLYLRIWDIDKNKQICQLLCGDNKIKNNKLIHGIDWNKNNELLVSLQTFVLIAKFDVNIKLQKINIIEIGINVFKSIFNKEENSIIVPLGDGSIKIYNNILNNKEKNPKPISTFKNHLYAVYDLKFNINKNYLASSSNDFKIGIYDYKDIKNIKFINFLIGHTDKIRELSWFKNNLLASGSWDNTIRIWDINLKICLEIIKVHQSDVYGLDISTFHPFLFLTSSRDNTIRVFNYKNSLQIDTLIQFCNKITENDLIEFGEQISNEFLYDEGIEDFWKILKRIKGNYNSFIDKYIEKKIKLNKEIDNFLYNKSIDFASKKNDIIDKLIDESAKLGNWEKYCELLIYENKWEDAICAAPHVSKEYWKYLINRYENYCKEENKEKQIYSELLNNDYKSLVNELINRRDYENAKLIYLCRSNKKLVKEKPEIKNDINDIDDNIIEKIQIELNQNKDINFLIENSANEFLIQGSPIFACNSFLMKGDYTNAIKCLIQSFNIELAFILMIISRDYIYNNEIICFIYEKMKKENNISSIIVQSKCPYNRYIYLKKLNEEKLFNSNEKDIITQYIITNNLEKLYIEFIQLSNIFINSLCDNNSLNENNLKEILNIIDAIKELELSFEQLNANIYQRLIIIVLLIETLNFNYLSCICLINEFIVTKKINFNNENDIKSLSYILNFIKYCKNSKFNQIYNDYDLSYEEINLINKIIKKINIKGNYKENYNKFSSLKDKYCKKFLCDYQLKRFYFLRNEILPTNNDQKMKSTISEKPIPSKMIKLKSGNKILKSEYLEMTKYLYIN